MQEKTQKNELKRAIFKKVNPYPLPRLEDATTENKNTGGKFYNQIINY